jgi:hypothetical protein
MFSNRKKIALSFSQIDLPRGGDLLLGVVAHQAKFIGINFDST